MSRWLLWLTTDVRLKAFPIEWTIGFFTVISQFTGNFIAVILLDAVQTLIR